MQIVKYLLHVELPASSHGCSVSTEVEEALYHAKNEHQLKCDRGEKTPRNSLGLED